MTNAPDQLTYDALLALPEHERGEVISGALTLSPAPRPSTAAPSGRSVT